MFVNMVCLKPNQLEKYQTHSRRILMKISFRFSPVFSINIYESIHNNIFKRRSNVIVVVSAIPRFTIPRTYLHKRFSLNLKVE